MKNNHLVYLLTLFLFSTSEILGQTQEQVTFTNSTRNKLVFWGNDQIGINPNQSFGLGLNTWNLSMFMPERASFSLRYGTTNGYNDGYEALQFFHNTWSNETGGNLRINSTNDTATGISLTNSPGQKTYSIISTGPNASAGPGALGIYDNTLGAYRLVINSQGNVGIGTSTPGKTYKLSVLGSIRAEEIVVMTGWSDFVFKSDYKLKSLSEVEKFIKENKHLPDVPSEKEVTENGVALGQVQSKLLQKIEELTLYVIQIEKENKKMRRRMLKMERSQNNKP
jgi:hypothetical protein